MTNARDLKRRIVSVQSTRQITRTMEMVATAKIRHSTNRLVQAQPFAQSLSRVLSDLSSHSIDASHPLLMSHEKLNAAIVVCIVSDRGLAGAFNSSVLKATERYITEKQLNGCNVSLIACGKKAVGYFKYRGVSPVLTFEDLSADPTLDQARQICSYCVDAYSQESCDEVMLCYNHTVNAATQQLKNEILFPIKTHKILGENPRTANPTEVARGEIDFSPEFEPDAQTVLDSLLPVYALNSVYKALIDSAAAEQGARRKAMKSATDNAADIIQTLEKIYNRVRQDAITTEITEIVGGAAALEE